MSLQGFPQNFPPPQTPLVVPDTGRPSQDGRFLWLALWSRTGAGTGLPSVGMDLVASGATQADALGLVNDWNVVGTVAAATGVAIPALNVGADCLVWNAGANALNVYPGADYEIDALGANAPYALAAGKMQWFRCLAPNVLDSMKLG